MTWKGTEQTAHLFYCQTPPARTNHLCQGWTTQILFAIAWNLKKKQKKWKGDEKNEIESLESDAPSMA